MIAGLDWWFWITVVLGTLSCLASLVQYFRGYEPDDYSQGPMLVLEAFLVVYLVGSIIMQAVGPGTRGDWLELLPCLFTPARSSILSASVRDGRLCYWRFQGPCLS